MTSVPDKKVKWKKFQKLRTFDSRRLSRRVKKAEGATVRHARKFIVGRLDNIRSVRRHVIGWLVLVGILILAVGAQLMWFQRNYQTSAPSPGGTYAEAVSGPINTLNPLYAGTSAELSASRLIFSSLYNYDTTGHLQNDLAESTQVDDSQTTYTLKLRQDAKWHDDMNVTADDVVFTVNLIKNPETRSPLSVNWRDVTVKAIDSRTVEFKLPVVYAAFPHALTFSILPKHILGDVAPATIRENTFSQAPIGSGPFSFRVIQVIDVTGQEKIVSLAAFPDYYKGEPRISHFDLHAYATQDQIVQALRTGEVNAASDMLASSTAEIDKHNYTINTQPIDNGVYAVLNVTTPILKDKAVRQALQLATDTAVIRKSLTITPPALDLPFIAGQVTGSDVLHAPKADSAKASSMLDAAGWKLDGNVRKKDGQPLQLTVVTTKNSQYEKALETLAGQWRKLGIVVTAKIVDTNDPAANFTQSTLQQRSYDVLLYELSIGADPDVYAYWHSSQIGANGYNFANYASAAADASLSSARARLEPDLRNAKYKAFAKQWLEDVPAIGLYQSISPYVVNKSLHTSEQEQYFVSPQDRYANVLYWSVNSKTVYKTP
jgi:peptide/nickel transport system substrate-binding protein